MHALHAQFDDPAFERYMRDIRRTKPLDRGEERELFRRAAAGDRQARDRLVSANLRFVVKVAMEFRNCPIPLTDLVNEGALGLIRAVEDFEPDRGLKFISYAVWWIKAYITRAINETGSAIRLPANQLRRLRKSLREQSRGGELDSEARVLANLNHAGLSLDAPPAPGQDGTRMDLVADPAAADPGARLEEEAMRESARAALRPLPAREALVLKGIFGIGLGKEKTLREVGEDLDLSHERVRQLRDQGLRRLRHAPGIERLRECFEAHLETAG